MTRDLKTERFEHDGEQGGVLEAIAAAAGTDDLVLKTVEVETHGATEQYVQVLERDMRGVGVNQFGQCLQRRIAAARPVNALEIGFEVYSDGHGFLQLRLTGEVGES